jgi:hypothetical protein
MKRALFIIAALLMVSWFLGFFLWNAGISIHILIIVSAIFCMQAVILTPRPAVVQKAKAA